jgi:membrane protein
MWNKLRRVWRGVGRGVKGVAKGLYDQDCLGLAAQVAYSALFSLFPFLLFLQGLATYLPGTKQLNDWLLGGLRDLITSDSRLYQIVQDNVFGEVGALSATLLSIGIVLTLWSASGAVMVLLKAVNRAYGIRETRSWQRRRSMAVVMAIAGAIIVPVGLLLLVFGSWIGDFIGNKVGYGSLLHSLWVGLRWPAVFVLLVGALGTFFYLAPSARQKWYAVWPGALFAMGAMTGASAGLSWFLGQGFLQVRWLTYGAIGIAIVLLFWAFLIALTMLVGAEINGEIRRAVMGRRFQSGQLLESEHYD